MDIVQIIKYIGLILTALVTLIGLIKGVLFLRAEFFTKRHFLDINYKNVMILPFCQFSPNGITGEQIYLFIYGLTITNTRKEPVTIKNVHLQYKIGGTQYEHDSRVVNTGKLKNGEEKAALLFAGPTNIIIQNWYNLRERIAELKALGPGNVLSGSAVFPMVDYADDIKKVTNIKLVIRDYLNKETTYDLEIQPEWTDGLKKGGCFVNYKFIQNPDDSIEFIH